MWFTGINYYKLVVEKDRDSSFTTITTIWKPRLTRKYMHAETLALLIKPLDFPNMKYLK
jgi:hypothetical protein